MEIDSNNAVANYDHLVPILLSALRASPNRVVAVFLSGKDNQVRRVLSAGELAERATNLAAALGAEFEGGQPVLLCADTSPDFYVAFIGCLFAQRLPVVAPVPRYPNSKQRLHTILDDCQPSLVLSEGDQIDKISSLLHEEFPQSQCKVKNIVSLEAAGYSDGNLLADCWHVDAPLLIQYTSGSTGGAKGVVVSSRNVISNAGLLERSLFLDSSSVMLSWLPNFHDMGLMSGILYPLLNGGLSVQLPTNSFLKRPYRWLKAISDENATHSGGPPFAYQQCVTRIRPDDLATLDLRSWLVAYCGAEPVPKVTMGRFRARFKACGFAPESLISTYGMAEATLFIGGHRLPAGQSTRHEESMDSGCEPCHLAPESLERIKIIDPCTGTELPNGRVGEIAICGDDISIGRWVNHKVVSPVSDTVKFESGEDWIRTGDLGALDGTSLHVSGRLDGMFHHLGRNITAAEVEWVAAAADKSLNPLACVLVSNGDIHDPEMAVIVELLPSKSPPVALHETEKLIKSAVSTQFGIHLTYVNVVSKGTIPRTTSGKLIRTKLAFEQSVGT